MNLRILYLTCVFSLGAAYATAQQGTNVFSFLNLPASSHAAALGGDNVSIVQNDLTLALHNPALLSSVDNKSLSLGYMSYMNGIGAYHAAYTRTYGERGTWAVAAQMVDYGKFDAYDEYNQSLGNVSAKDMAMSGIYAYNLSDYISGGVTAKAIYSKYAEYSSFAVGIDLGLNYYNSNRLLSISLVARNLGAQLKHFDETSEDLPVNILIGITKQPLHAPFRFSMTMQQLNHWEQSFIHHFIFGVDFLASENFYMAVGYNARRAYEMKVNDAGSKMAGLSLGAGITTQKFKIDVSYAKYHVSGSSLLVNLGIGL